MWSFHVSRCVKSQKDTLLYTYATVNECCSYKYQNTGRKGAWGTGAGLAIKLGFIQPKPFTYALKGRPNQIHKQKDTK